MLRAMDGLYYWFGDMGLDYETSAFLSFTLFLMLFVFVIALIKLIFHIVAEWIFFKKCGEDGWKALIPIYNEITLIKLSGLNWWWIFLIYGSSIFSLILFPLEMISVANESALLTSILFLFSLFSFAVSAATIVAKINECNNISKKFNKGAGHTALLFFFEPIMFLVMGLSSSYEYDKELYVPKNGFFSK